MIVIINDTFMVERYFASEIKAHTAHTAHNLLNTIQFGIVSSDRTKTHRKSFASFFTLCKTANMARGLHKIVSLLFVLNE